MVLHEAPRLDDTFKAKGQRAKELIIYRVIKLMGLVQRAATHTAQKDFKVTEDAAKDFIELAKQMITGMNPDDVINMDQTPIPFSFHSNRTLEMKGMRTIHVRASTGDTKRVTLAATVTLSGKMLTPFFIFKGSPTGRIAKKEFPSFSPDGKYACQKSAWMDEERMHIWIDIVLKPWMAERAPSPRPPILILDAYSVHHMGSVVNHIQGLGIKVIHIPAGCTYLCQPIDVGINKPIKVGLRKQWEDWMISGGGVVTGKVSEPTRKQITEWVSELYTNISREVAMNAWKKSGYEWV